MIEQITFSLNGKPIALEVEANRTLLWVLRNDLSTTGTKFGCGLGDCGACTVLVDGRAEQACTLAVRRVQGREVTTIEGLAEGDRLHPVQEAFVKHDALQCGYCTPGMIMQAVSLLTYNPRPSREEILEEMDGNLCRCGAHHRIVRAVQDAAVVMVK